MRFIAAFFASLTLIAELVLAASGIDGKWVTERKWDRDGQPVVITQIFDLKSDGSKLSGKITTKVSEMEPATVDIREGKIEGEKASWSTISPNQSIKFNYKATLSGDTLKGESAREGTEPRPFEAKRKRDN
jgi:hypothetical protein